MTNLFDRKQGMGGRGVKGKAEKEIGTQTGTDIMLIMPSICHLIVTRLARRICRHSQEDIPTKPRLSCNSSWGGGR